MSFVSQPARPSTFWHHRHGLGRWKSLVAAPFLCVLAVELLGGMDFVKALMGLWSQDPQQPGAFSLPLGSLFRLQRRLS